MPSNSPDGAVKAAPSKADRHRVMRVVHGVVIALAWVGLCAGPSYGIRISGELNDFNGYVMEAPLTHYPSLKLIKTWSTDFVKEVGLYENPGEKPAVGGVSF